MEESKFIKIKTVLGICLVMVMGLIGASSEFYPEIMYKFYLTEKAPMGVNYQLLIIYFFLIFGGAYFQKVSESISNAISVFISKFKK